jgi:hypothetical protein
MTYPEFHHLGFKMLTTFFMFQCINYMNVNLQLKVDNQKKINEIKNLIQSRDIRP